VDGPRVVVRVFIAAEWVDRLEVADGWGLRYQSVSNAAKVLNLSVPV